MTRTGTILALLCMAGAPVLAQGAALPADPDGNGTWSLAELQAAVPDLTEETFRAIDSDGDGEVNPDELQAAIGAGLIVLPG